MKKIIATLTAIAVLISFAPTKAYASNADSQNTILEVTVDSAPLRNKASKKGKVIVELNVGDCITCVGSTVNNAGNLWYIIDYGEKKLYIYSENVKEHTHSLCKVEDSNISICCCGYYEAKIEDMYSLNAATHTGFLLNPATVAVGGELATMLGAAAPYVIITIVCGTLLYVAINTTSTRADVASVSKDFSELNPDMVESGNYYYCARRGNMLFIAYNNPINVDEAETFICGACRMSFPQLNFGPGVEIRNLYTLSEDDASALVKKISKNSDILCEYDSAHRDGYFQHYNFSHIFDGSTKRTKVHLFFALPMVVEVA